jgi:tRNA threonylcarbamoyladenosine biosynthesis protein TsaB
VTAFGVARGPGAFTGVRVGIAAAAGLSRATGAPLYGATSLELAARAAGPGDPVWVVLNAYRNEVYAQRFVVDAARRVVALTEPVVEAPAVLLARLDDGPLRLTGSGVDAYSAELAEEARTRGEACRWTVVPAPVFVAGELAELVAERVAAKLLPDRVTPCYVRQSEAEINLKAGRLESAGAPRVL